MYSRLRFMRSTACTVASRLLPASLLHYETAFGVLARIYADLRISSSAGEAARVLDKSRASLQELLVKRFSQIEAQALTLKCLNIFLSGYHLRARDTAILSRPFGLVVDPSNVCQLSCPGCVHSQGSEKLKLFDWPKATLPESRFEALLRLYGATAIGVYFCNYGEPLLNLNTPQLVRRAKAYLAATALSTSMSVQRFDPEAYVTSGLDLMIVSIDGATQSVYDRFRRNGNLELVLGNVAKLVDAKKKLANRTPLLSWNFLAFQHNSHEIPAAEKMARRLGFNYFRVVKPFDVSWDDPEVRPAEVKPYVRRLDWTSSNPSENWNPLPQDLASETIAAAFERGFNLSTSGDRAGSSGHTCHWLYKNMVMDASGRVLPCCGAPRPDAKLIFGKVDGTDRDPFNVERYRQARAFFAGQSSASGVLQCHDCTWDQTTVNIGSPEIQRYFRSADPWFFDRRSVDLLAAS